MARTLPTRATSRAEVARRYVPIPTGDGRESLRVPLRARGARKRSARARHRGPRSIPISILNILPVIARSVATKQSRKQLRLLRFARNDRAGAVWWLWLWLWLLSLLLGPVERAEHRSLSRGVSRDRDRARAAWCIAAGELVSRPGE